MARALAAGETLAPRSPMEVIQRSNEQHAQNYATIGKRETIDTLRRDGAVITQLLRGPADEQLDRMTMAFGGQEWTVARMVERVVIGHTKMHLANIRATIAA